MKILLVDDDEQTATLVMAALTTQGYTVDTATDGLDGWELINASPYDLVLLDVMMPKLDGITFCRRLRDQKRQIPVILLTARDTGRDKMTGLDAGADDYLVKPIDLQELTARIRALLRRGSSDHSPILEWGELQLNPATLEVKYGGQPLNFRRKEFAILELLMRNRQRVFSRSSILDHLWSFDEAPSEETIKAHIKAIRQQLRTVGAENLIETLYGQGYRLNLAYLSMKPAKSSPTAIDSEQAEATRSMVAQIWQQTRGVSRDRLSVLEQAVQALEAGNLNLALRQKAEQSAHKLHGSLGTFGFIEGSQIARQLETLFQAGSALERTPIQQIAQQLEALRQLIEADNGQPPVGTSAQKPIVPAATSAPLATTLESAAVSNSPLLLIVDDDRTLAEQLALEAMTCKLRTEIAPDLATARSQIRQSYPDVILLDLSFQSGENGLTLLEELAAYRSQIPVLVFTERDRFTDRVAVARMGGSMFLQKPTNPAEVLQAVMQVLQRSQQSDAKILAVDDDLQILLTLKAVLEPWGLQITLLEDSTQFWDVLETIQPEMVILDVEMPEIDGVELCQTIRSDPRWSWISVLFLTARIDAATKNRVYEVGADDYITKPILAAELVNRILNRLKRTALLRHQTEMDPVTGIANRQRSTQDLEKLLELAQHTNQPLCLAVLEVDSLKGINTRYGHAAGEKALRQMGQWLKQRLRREDVVARWGGAEFVVAMYGMTQSDGVEWLAEILEALRSQTIFCPNDDHFQVSFSAGVVQYPTDGTDVQMLYRSADSVLYWAKELGGDRVLPFGWQPSDEDPVEHADVSLIYPENDFAYQIFQALETRGYHAEWFKTEAEALSALGGESPRLRSTVIVWGNLSDNLLGITKKIDTKILKQSRVIALLSQASQAEAVLNLGAADYILTPCSVSVVMQSLRTTLGT